MTDRADKKKAVAIKVPAKDPKHKDGAGDDGDGSSKPAVNGAGKASGGDKGSGKKRGKGGKDVVEPEELSEEDKALKEGLELAVTRVEDTEPGIGELVVRARRYPLCIFHTYDRLSPRTNVYFTIHLPNVGQISMWFIQRLEHCKTCALVVQCSGISATSMVISGFVLSYVWYVFFYVSCSSHAAKCDRNGQTGTAPLNYRRTRPITG